MTLYLCTAGTSIATGPGADGPSLAARISAKIATAQARHRDDPRAFLIAVSAETNGLARCDCGPGDEVQLLATDTNDGLQCAEAVAELVRTYLGAKASAKRIDGLVVDKESRFRRQGVGNLLNFARARAHEHGGDVVFNVTGGYKGVVPYLTLLGMFEGCEVHYVFENVELIRLPALPVRLDLSRVAAAAPALAALGAKGIMKEAEFDALPPGGGVLRKPDVAPFLEIADGIVALSAAGQLALAEIARERARAAGRGRLFVRRGLVDSPLWSNHRVQRKLPDLVDERLRQIPDNRHTMKQSTDLFIAKTRGYSAPRIYYKLRDEDVYLVDLVTHDEHENVIQPGNRKLYWADYADARFDELPLDEPAPDFLGEALAAFIDEVDESGRAAEARAAEAEKREREARKALERREARDEAAALPYRAAAWAARAFCGRTRKDAAATPYVNHLLEVVSILAEAGVTDPVVLAAGWLHDAVEDVGANEADLARDFGAEATRIVSEVSDDKRLAKDERKRRQIANAGKKSPGARLVGLADKIANLRDLDRSPPADWDLDRRIGYFDWAKAVVEAMGEPKSGAETRLIEAFGAALAGRPRGG